MKSPIQNKIGMVFIPVSDMDRAIQWYSRLLEVPVGNPSHDGKIYNLPMQGEVGILLDANEPVRNSCQPLVFFWTDDIDSSLRHLHEQSAQIVSAIEDIGTVRTLTFQDPDGNLLMVCQSNRAAET